MNFIFDYPKTAAGGLIGLWFVFDGMVGMVKGEYTIRARGAGADTIVYPPLAYVYSMFSIVMGTVFIYLLIKRYKQFVIMKRTLLSDHFDIPKLRELLNLKHINEKYFSIDGVIEEKKYHLLNDEGRWEVFYLENGVKAGRKVFVTESEACRYLFEWMNDAANNAQ